MDTNGHKKLVTVVFALALVVGLIFWSNNNDATEEVLVSLIASTDKTTYAIGEPVSITMKITNDGISSVCLSETPLGNITFQSVTRDGSPVGTRIAPSYFLTSLTEMVKSKLTDVAPNTSVEIFFTSSYDPGLSSDALYTTALDETSGITTFYDIGKPGEYKIDAVYEYQGPSSDRCSTVFENKTNSVTVSFTVNS